MSRILAVFLSLAFLIFAGCANKQPVVPEPTKLPPLSKDPDGLDTVEGKVCAKLRDLGCSEGRPDAKGRSCYQLLVAYEAEGASISSPCILNAKTKSDLDACNIEGVIPIRCVP